MARKRLTMERWIDQCFQDKDKLKPLSALVLVHVKNNGIGTDDVHKRELSGQTFSSAELAEFFQDKACNYAQDMEDRQNFKLFPFFGEREPQAPYIFAVFEGEIVTGNTDIVAKSAPTDRGLLAQLMRHNEMLVSANMDMVKTFAVRSIESDQRARTAEQEATTIVRDVLLNFEEKKQAHELRMLEFQRATQERRAMFDFIPEAVNSLSKKQIISGEYSDKKLIDSLAFNTSPEQLKMLGDLGILPPQIIPVIQARLERARQERKQEQEFLAKVPDENIPKNKDGNGAPGAQNS